MLLDKRFGGSVVESRGQVLYSIQDSFDEGVNECASNRIF
jgi:hypothetical protein